MLGIFITKNAFTSHCTKLTFVLYLYCICIVLTLYLHRIWTIFTLYLYCIWTLFTLYLYCICRAIMGHTMQGAFITPLWAITEDTLQGPSQLLCPSCFSFEVKFLLGISSDLSHSKPRIIPYRAPAGAPTENTVPSVRNKICSIIYTCINALHHKYMHASG